MTAQINFCWGMCPLFVDWQNRLVRKNNFGGGVKRFVTYDLYTTTFAIPASM
jgi:hypothetical protein